MRSGNIDVQKGSQMSETNREFIAYILDDDDDSRGLLVSRLRSHGLSVAAFSCAADFIENHDRSRLACLILESKLPDMTGLELQGIFEQPANLASPDIFHRIWGYFFCGQGHPEWCRGLHPQGTGNLGRGRRGRKSHPWLPVRQREWQAASPVCPGGLSSADKTVSHCRSRPAAI